MSLVVKDRKEEMDTAQVKFGSAKLQVETLNTVHDEIKK